MQPLKDRRETLRVEKRISLDLLGCMRYILRSTAIVGAGPELRHLRITFNGRGLLRGRGHVSRSSDERSKGKGDKCTYRSQT